MAVEIVEAVRGRGGAKPKAAGHAGLRGSGIEEPDGTCKLESVRYVGGWEPGTRSRRRWVQTPGHAVCCVCESSRAMTANDS